MTRDITTFRGGIALKTYQGDDALCNKTRMSGDILAIENAPKNRQKIAVREEEVAALFGGRG